jgi:hypothetical protein
MHSGLLLIYCRYEATVAEVIAAQMLHLTESYTFLLRLLHEDRLCSLVVRVPGYRTEMYCVSCQIRTEFIYVMLKKVYRLLGLLFRVPGYRMEMCCASWRQARVPQGSVLSPTLYNLYINDTLQTPGVNLALFADDTCLYATDRKEGYVLRKIQRGLDSMAAWCKHWNIKTNEDKTRAIYFTRRNRPPDSLLTVNGRNIPFVNTVRYLGVLFDKRKT